MEAVKAKEWARVNYDYYYGDGYGSGFDSGDGYGFGYGDGYGYGYGDGSGFDYGEGYGFGYGYGEGISSYCGHPVVAIDNIATIVYVIHGNVAKGAILNSDLTLSPCYIVKNEDSTLFAHGETLVEARDALADKRLTNMDVEERISEFVRQFRSDAKYPAKDFFRWHNLLTGSCEIGRNQFVQQGGYDLERDMFTVQEFIDITKNAYGGSVIKQLAKQYN